MLFLDRCRYCTVDGFLWDSANADVVVDMDGGTGGIGTACTLSRLLMGNGQARSTFVGVRISETTTNNQEYHLVKQVNINGFDSTAILPGISISASSSSAHAASAGFSSGDVGKRIRIASAGSGGGTLDTTISAFVSTTQVTVALAASATVTGAYALIGEAVGTGIRIGPSANAKRIAVEDCNVNMLNRGIRAENGSFQSRFNSFFSNETNISIGNLTEPCLDLGSNTEKSRQHLQTAAAFPVTMQGCRFDLEQTAPGTDYVSGTSSGKITIIGCSTENALPDSSTYFCSGDGFGFIYTLIGNNFGSAMTMQQLGRFAVDSPHVFINNQNVSDLPKEQFLGGGLFTAAIDPGAGAIEGRAISNGSGSTPDFCAGVRGEAIALSGHAFDAVACAVQAALGGGGSILNGMNYRGVDIQFPTSSLNQHGKLLEGVRVHSPSGLTGSALMDKATGLIIEEMTTGNIVGLGVGIDQQGADDHNYLAGRTFQGAPASAPSDSELSASQLSFHVDESGNNLLVRVKYSNGTTLKTGTIALV
ncbi:MAG: hypothetical protein JWO05_2006 [Gemmatimonadetes bacterium]|nr:hypothetical protein [Gemmatimonadota bacterium]